MPDLIKMGWGQHVVVQVEQDERRGHGDCVAAPEDGNAFGVDGVTCSEYAHIDNGELAVVLVAFLPNEIRRNSSLTPRLKRQAAVL